MVLEEQILRYYLKVFKNLLFLFFILLLLFLFNSLIKKNNIIQNNISIKKGSNITSIINEHFSNIYSYEVQIFKIYHYINNLLFNKYIHYGDFYIDDKISLLNFYNIISNPSNLVNKITILEGWSKDNLNKEFKKYFNNVYEVEYDDIIADTYFFNKNEDFAIFIEKLKVHKENYVNKFLDNIFFENFNEFDLFKIASLIEKEGLDKNDKKKIYSVIYNRLNINMKLQIDATVLYAITDGKYNLNRNLNLNDLKIQHPYNTYYIYGLPPKPIAYVGTKTLELIFENYESDYLFYFFDNTLNRHIFSKNFNDHKIRLNEYRNKK